MATALGALGLEEFVTVKPLFRLDCHNVRSGPWTGGEQGNNDRTYGDFLEI